MLCRSRKPFVGPSLNFHWWNNSSKENNFSSWKPLNWVMLTADYLAGLLGQEEIKFHWICYLKKKGTGEEGEAALFAVIGQCSDFCIFEQPNPWGPGPVVFIFPFFPSSLLKKGLRIPAEAARCFWVSGECALGAEPRDQQAAPTPRTFLSHLVVVEQGCFQLEVSDGLPGQLLSWSSALPSCRWLKAWHQSWI